MYGFVLLILAGMSSTCISQMLNRTLVKRGIQSRAGDEGLPEECQGKTYCTIKTDDYPEEIINKMLEEQCILPHPKILGDASPSEVQRIHSNLDYDDNCESKVTFDPVYKVKVDGKWYFVPQVAPKNFVQKMRLEECVDEGKHCFTAAGYTSDVKTKCKQDYVNWDFWALPGEDLTKFIKVTASMPVCCSCHYKVD